VIVVIGVAAYLYLPGQSSPPQSSSQAASVSQTSASANSTSGLVLELRLNVSLLAPGQTIAANVSELNSKAQPNNVTAASQWAVQGLSIGPCGSNTPLGIGIFSGRFTKGNISSAQQLQIYNPAVYACPARFSISSFLFQAGSDSATIAGSCQSQCTTYPMSGGDTASGYFGGSGSSFQQFPAGLYTVVGVDEWGAAVFLYFQVT